MRDKMDLKWKDGKASAFSITGREQAYVLHIC